MLSINPFTSYNIVDILNKPLYFIETDQLNVCNLISPDDLGFFQEYYGNYYTEIVYYEYERPTCPKCDISMNSNGSRPAKPNKWEGIRKKQYICPECGERDTFQSVDDRVSCKKCGLSFQYDEYGMLKNGPFETLREFAKWQNGKVEEHVAENVVYIAEHATLSTLKQQEDTLVAEGTVAFSKEGLVCGDINIPMDSITDLAMHGRRAVVFTADKAYYEMIPSKGSNSLKFLLYYNEYRKAGK